MISRFDSVGTKHSGYVGPEFGLKGGCIKCIHYTSRDSSSGTCDHPDVKKDADEGTISLVDKKPLVASQGCCGYVRRG